MGAWPSLAVEGEDGPLLTKNQVVDLYVEIAFGSEFGVLAPASNQSALDKRRTDAAVNIVPLPQSSVPLAEPTSLVQSIVSELNLHSGGLRLIAYMPEDMKGLLERVSRDRSIYLDTVLVYIGSRSELNGLIDKASSENLAIQRFRDEVISDPENDGRPLCAAASFVRDDGILGMGTAAVWVEYGPHLRACLFEEIIQSFGLGNDFAPGTPSIFNDDDVYDAPTALDWQLWRVHTDPRLKHSMGPAEAREIVQEILGGFSE